MSDVRDVLLRTLNECDWAVLERLHDREEVAAQVEEWLVVNPAALEQLLERTFGDEGWTALDEHKKIVVGPRAYKEALAVQDACNPLPVVRAFYMAALAVHRASEDQERGTDWIAGHPVMVLFASKMASLTDCDAAETFRCAYRSCREKQRNLW